MSKQIFMGRQKGSKNQVNKIAQAIETQAEKPLFSEQHSSLARQIKPLFNFPEESNRDFEIKLKYFMTKDNLFVESFNYYWMTVFFKEQWYYDMTYIKKELGIT